MAALRPSAGHARLVGSAAWPSPSLAVCSQPPGRRRPACAAGGRCLQPRLPPAAAALPAALHPGSRSLHPPNALPEPTPWSLLGTISPSSRQPLFAPLPGRPFDPSSVHAPASPPAVYSIVKWGNVSNFIMATWGAKDLKVLSPMGIASQHASSRLHVASGPRPLQNQAAPGSLISTAAITGWQWACLPGCLHRGQEPWPLRLLLLPGETHRRPCLAGGGL